MFDPVEEDLGNVEHMVDQLPVRARPPRQHLVQPVVGDLGQIARGGVEDHQDLFGHRRRRQHLGRAIGKAGDLGDIAEHRAIGPHRAARDHRHQTHAEGLQFGETGIVLEHIDGMKVHAVIEQKFLGLEATGTAWLPVDF